MDISEIKAHADGINAAIKQTEDKAKMVLRAREDEYHTFIVDNIAKYEQLAQDAATAQDAAVANRSRIMAAVYQSMLDSFMQSRRYAAL